jgi:hypothetical protein
MASVNIPLARARNKKACSSYLVPKASQRAKSSISELVKDTPSWRSVDRSEYWLKKKSAIENKALAKQCMT